ncbi:chaperone protein dnaj, putative [Perkinsus marinus ATCC 50983]|uniref:Chaperone protein dnaj, putative n=1 Tax=Perkinsus marinus (strain ATCC 50983 / TXsc) TaxID=423536 RepID=C5KL89_PERM5|nr:chaperone protein dnaj, putative [Perkinsus marinus ATCC 50983]EER14762.1 chaperone protein dnaj, putative [Perkinsus marinus ATCC 50983]|eukprot:XP_002782966.1 chaperone protein dnaj, putative [Perkinsus marinus ATCC 50983]
MFSHPNVILVWLLSTSSLISQTFVPAAAANADGNFDATVDYYRVLGVDERASAAEIKHSYKSLARKHHPDVSSAPDATSRFAEINEAYEVLGNARTRSDYDAARRFKNPQYGQFSDVYGRGHGGRPRRYTYVYRYQSPSQYHEFDPRDFFDFYTTERARRDGGFHQNSDNKDTVGRSRDIFDEAQRKLMDILTPVCILFMELVIVHTTLVILMH